MIKPTLSIACESKTYYWLTVPPYKWSNISYYKDSYLINQLTSLSLIFFIIIFENPQKMPPKGSVPERIAHLKKTHKHYCTWDEHSTTLLVFLPPSSNHTTAHCPKIISNFALEIYVPNSNDSSPNSGKRQTLHMLPKCVSECGLVRVAYSKIANNS